MSVIKTTADLHTLTINYLTEDMYNDALNNNEINDEELYITPISEDIINYSVTPPTSANEVGLKVVLLDIEPAQKYNGWLYLIKES